MGGTGVEEKELKGRPVECNRIPIMYQDCLQGKGAEECKGYKKALSRCRESTNSGEGSELRSVDVPRHLLLKSLNYCLRNEDYEKTGGMRKCWRAYEKYLGV